MDVISSTPMRPDSSAGLFILLHIASNSSAHSAKKIEIMCTIPQHGWFHHLQDGIHQKDEELVAWDRALKRADERIATLNNDKDRMSEDYKEERADLARRIETLEKEVLIRDEHVRMLKEELAKKHGPDGINGRPLLIAGLPATGYPTGGTLSNREQEALNLTYQE
jgi:hypothetical protein